MRMFAYVWILALVGASLLLLQISRTKSCGRAEGKPPMIKVDVAFPIESLDPRYATSATSSRISNLVYASLFEMGDDISPQPFLAQAIEALDDKTFAITLKPHLTFHDGTSLTADDVVYTYTELGTEDVASPHAAKFDYIESITEINDQRIIFALKKPHAPFITDLCAIGIVSRKACAGRSDKCRHEHVGSGPYQVKHWDSATETLHLAPFTAWFEGPPSADLLFRVVRDENTRMLELIGEKADLVDSDFSPSNAFELKKQSHLDLLQVPGLGFRYLAINVRGPRSTDELGSPAYLSKTALADKRVRKALAHSVNFEHIIDKLLLKTATRASGLIPNGHWAKDESLKAPSFDQEKARALLDEAGFKKAGPKKTRFKITLSTTSNRMSLNISQLIADFLRQVDIEVDIRVKDWSALYQDMKKGQFEMFSAIWVPVTEPDLYHFVHHSSSIPSDEQSGGNRHGYKNLQVDRLIDLGRTTIEQGQRTSIYQKIEKILIDDLPYIPMWNDHRLVIINNKKIAGFKPSPTGSLLNLRHARIVNNRAEVRP